MHQTWDGRAAGSSYEAEGHGGSFASRVVTWAVLGVIGYVLYNAFVRTSGVPTGE